MRVAQTVLPLLLVISFTSAPASAQDDLLAPLTPSTRQTKKVNKKRPARTRAAKPKAKDDEFLAPLVQKTELLVKVGGGLRARLFVDGQEVGVITTDPFEVTPGPHRIAVRRPGFADALREVTVPEGERVEVSVNLEAIAGVLTVLASVPNAKVFLDGSFEGSVPLRDLLVAPGMHEVKISAEGHVSETQRLTVKAGKDYTVNAELLPGRDAVASVDRPERAQLTPADGEDEPGPVPLVAAARPQPTVNAQPGAWYQQWYVWAGAGAVVIGAVATSVAIASSGPDLTQNPDTVCGGRCAGVLIPSVR